MRILFKIYVFALLVFCSIALYGQTYNVKHISGLEGLSQNTVNSICVDHVGYIWLGTDFGLNRYDGRTIKKYYNDNYDPQSLSSDFINLIYEDQSNNLWVSTSGGLCIYNRIQDKFYRNPLGGVDFSLTAVYEDENEVWFPNSRLEFHIYNKNSGTVRRLQIKPIFQTTQQTLEIADVVFFDENVLLLLIQYTGLALFDKNTGELRELINFPGQFFTGMEVADNTIYLSSYNNVYKISGDGKILNRFKKVNPALGDPIFLSLNENPADKSIWLTTEFNGILICDRDFNIVNNLKAGPNERDILPENSIKNILFTKSGMVLLGTVRCGGIILYPSGFEQYQYINQSNYGPSDKTILCFREDSYGQIWLGTGGGGLNLFEKETNTFQHFYTPEIQSVTSILDFSPDLLLVASYKKGLFFFNKKTKQFSSVKNHPLLKQINYDVRHKIFRDSEENIWISDGSIVKINLKNNTFERFDRSSNNNFLQNLRPIYYSVFESTSGLVWFTTEGGFFSYSLKQKKFIDKVVLSNLRGSYGSIVYSAVEDEEGNIIFGTSKGLFYYNINTKIVSDYINNSTYKNKMFLSLYFDNNNYLWAGTNEALVRIEKNDLVENISVFNNLGIEGGLEYRYGAVLRTTDGSLFMGSNEGITRFNPENIKIDTTKSKVFITSFKRMSNMKGEISDSTLIVDMVDDFSTELDYAPAIYQFNFNSFNLPFEENTEYSYTMENFEESWHSVKSNTATYTNLAEGDYIFRVRSTNKTGNWCTETTNVFIKILPPWWQTFWFRLLFVLIVLIIIIIIWVEILSRIKLRHQLLFEKREKEQHEKINKQKLQFFTNISHELRTPLTLIYSPLKHLLSNNSSDFEIRNALPSLYRNTRRMKTLIEQILEFRKTEMSILKLNAESADLVEFCRETIDYFSHHAKIENINIILEAESEKIVIDFDKDKLTKIMFNLISNAITHSKSGDIIFLLLSSDNDNAKIEVKDSGKGIPQSNIAHIFERYYQVEPDVAGTGIGLALTKRLVRLHGGTISVQSNVGEGSTFIVLLPLKQESLVSSKLLEKQHDTPIETESFGALAEVLNTDIGKKLILFIEDEWEFRHYLETELSKKYKVLLAKNGREGFEIALKELPDLIISDVMMPEMDGIEFCKNLKNDIRISHIPVILLTAKISSEDQASGLNSGADIYISKPFDLDLLIMQIDSLFYNRQILKRRFMHDLGLNPSDLIQSPADEKFLINAIGIVERNLENQDFKVSDFVNELGMSRTLVYNKINAIAGKPVKDFILHIRLRKAAQMLAGRDIPVSQIAFECGFSDSSFFSAFYTSYQVAESGSNVGRPGYTCFSDRI